MMERNAITKKVRMTYSLDRLPGLANINNYY
jgi:hypothetical protein